MIHRQTHTTESDWLAARQRVVTATEVAALFGVNPRLSRYELWQAKHRQIVPPVRENERMMWGRELQDIIGVNVAAMNGHEFGRLRPHDFIHDDELRLGATLDGEIDEAPCEVKMVDYLVYRDQWAGDHPPKHIELQIRTQMMLMDAPVGWVAVLVAGNEGHLIRIDRSERVEAAIRKLVADFWSGPEPTPDLPADADAVASVYGAAESATEDRTDDAELAGLVDEYRTASRIIADATAAKDTAKAKILMTARARKTIVGKYTIHHHIIPAKTTPAHTVPEKTKAEYTYFRVNGGEE